MRRLALTQLTVRCFFMPSFVLDSGRLARAAFGRVTHDGLSEEICRTVREGVIDLLDQPLFPVAWDDGEPPVLTAMDRASRVVTVAVLPRLAGDQMMDLLARAGLSATTAWRSIAERYDGGVPAFRRDWNAFRESLPPSGPPAPHLIVLAGELDAEVAQALPVLDGVQVRRLQVRSTDTGQLMVELDDATTLPGDLDQTREPRRASAAAPAARTPAPGTHGTGLSAVANLVGEPVQIELRANGTAAHRATLRTDGTLVLADGTERTDLEDVTADLLPGQYRDPWQAWRFVQGGLPLAEALTEAQLRQANPLQTLGRRRGRGPA